MKRGAIIGGLASVFVVAIVMAVNGIARPSDGEPGIPADMVERMGGRAIGDGQGSVIERLGDINPARDGGEELVFEKSRFLLNGVPLRDTRMGGINITGLPPGSTVHAAYLYWQWACLEQPQPGVHDTMTFGRIYPTPRVFSESVTGEIVGSGANPCWCGPESQNVNYRADVTDIVTDTQGGYYGVILSKGAAGSVDYADAWAGALFRDCDAVAQSPAINGAALLVIYTSPCEENGTVVVYDQGISGHMFTPIPGIQFDLVHPATDSQLARIAFANGDGQVGLGYVPSFGFTNEITRVNDQIVAGDGSTYHDSHWNGLNGQPLPQLFDVVGQELEGVIVGGATRTSVEISSPAGPGLSDCVVPAMGVLWLR